MRVVHVPANRIRTHSTRTHRTHSTHSTRTNRRRLGRPIRPSCLDMPAGSKSLRQRPQHPNSEAEAAVAAHCHCRRASASWNRTNSASWSTYRSTFARGPTPPPGPTCPPDSIRPWPTMPRSDPISNNKLAGPTRRRTRPEIWRSRCSSWRYRPRRKGRRCKPRREKLWRRRRRGNRRNRSGCSTRRMPRCKPWRPTDKRRWQPSAAGSVPSRMSQPSCPGTRPRSKMAMRGCARRCGSRPTGRRLCPGIAQRPRARSSS
mmetsp:Transcript_3629/g.8396  ORF Transcript_3629/g.8396 Transcript_3629/m.8396 type:complete len:260 (-) Transcript_3629:961-1740(-)